MYILITSTLPAKTQHVIHYFGTAEQEFLTLRMEATRPFEVTETAPHPARTEQSALDNNTADRT